MESDRGRLVEAVDVGERWFKAMAPSAYFSKHFSRPYSACIISTLRRGEALSRDGKKGRRVEGPDLKKKTSRLA